LTIAGLRFNCHAPILGWSALAVLQLAWPRRLWFRAAPCRIEVVDKACGWPVPLVELQTLHGVRFVTDNAGVIAFDLPELMGKETWFDVKGQGYEVKKDGFGYAGFRFTPEPGQVHRVEVERTIIARRLGRITGGGLFGESQKLGAEPAWRESGLLGQDSVQNAVYRGNFSGCGATRLCRNIRWVYLTAPARRLRRNRWPPLNRRCGCRWIISGTKRRAQGPGQNARFRSDLDLGLREPARCPGARAFGGHLRERCGFVHDYRRGLAVWDDATESFKCSGCCGRKPPPLRILLWRRMDTPSNGPMTPGNHGCCFAIRFPMMRCPATFEAWQDTNSWERLTPPKHCWRREHARKRAPASGSMAWNSWRKRWVSVFVQADGKPSPLGEVWYAEARAPTGPWGPAVKILSHDNYTFYNPSLHPEFTPENSPVLIFEGTYSAEFARNPPKTPRYNYNQILYRLDLDDPRLLLEQ
jgi:hypothetical protein